MFNVPCKGLVDPEGGVPAENPVNAVRFLNAQDVRDRVLTRQEFERILELSSGYLKLVLFCAYSTGMRTGEILDLTWDSVDLKAGFSRLRGIDTKTGEARSIPIGRELQRVFESLPIACDPQGIRVPHARMRDGRPINSIQEVSLWVCRQAGLSDVGFHDLRHTATTNLRRAGGEALAAMKITGHRTIAAFKRYNTIDEGDLAAAQRQMDTAAVMLREERM